MTTEDPSRVRRVPDLTHREREILLAWLAEDSKRAAAARLFVTTSTVATTLERIRGKYRDAGRPARTKTALFSRAVQDGLIDLDEF